MVRARVLRLSLSRPPSHLPMTMTRLAVFMTDEVTGPTSAVNWKAVCVCVCVCVRQRLDLRHLCAHPFRRESSDCVVAGF
jgi:hypothetical protein